ncbi:MAG: helix-turn-helix domain-containing protein [Actinobacteria bacterium]|nr:helix-turn-helix domain-containing protein [Actinomycetota bacterium]
MSALPVSVVPGAGDVELARDALRLVDEALTENTTDGPVTLTVAGAAENVVVPKTVVGLLSRILANLANGEGVAVIPVDRELSTQKAADMLNVSRPFLIRLLEEGRIDFRLVGTHRRVKTASLLRYLSQDEAERRAAADELSRMTKELGFA